MVDLETFYSMYVCKYVWGVHTHNASVCLLCSVPFSYNLVLFMVHKRFHCIAPLNGLASKAAKCQKLYYENNETHISSTCDSEVHILTFGTQHN